jgi:hypothetical protein
MEEAPSVARLLTEQFYRWELRGRGWLHWDAPVALEPPYRPFTGHRVPDGCFADDGRFETAGSRFLRGLAGLLGAPRDDVPALRGAPTEDEDDPLPEPAAVDAPPAELQIALPPAYQPAANVFEQFLFSVGHAGGPLAFEVVGTADELVTQLAGEAGVLDHVRPQLKAHFPEAELTAAAGTLAAALACGEENHCGVLEFGLEREFMVPVATLKQFATDPLVAVCGALELLQEGEGGVFQVRFEPVRHPWAASALQAVTTADGGPFFADDHDLVPAARLKAARPLYAAGVRIAARSASEGRTRELLRSLAGAAALFGQPQGNRLLPLQAAGAGEELAAQVPARTSCRSGMLLNSDELVALAHLPSTAVRARRLRRAVRVTRPAPALVRAEGLRLGENVHEGEVTAVHLQTEHRLRHTHVIGASGTGKSTLLLQMIAQDIAAGRGVAVVDPHGDLVDHVLAEVPEERHADVILFDPADDAFPLGFNILSAHSHHEQSLLASDLVMIFRRLATSWGDQMTSILGNAVLAFLESPRGGTLPELRRFLVEAGFRREFLATVRDPEVVYFWEHEFPHANRASLGSILTRLDTFLRPKAIRHLVAQRGNALDFGRIMDGGRILLAKLSQGLVGEENSQLLGSLLVAKLNQLAIARQAQDAAARRPFFVYLDEFHHFITPSLGAIVTGARKYGLGLTLAHQSLRQLQRHDETGHDILGNTFTRVCFRVGDDDARRLAEGFGHFTATDLQNLPNFEALCRVEKKENDFNLRTLAPEPLPADAVERRLRLRDLSRSRHGTPRETVEAELAATRYVPTPAPGRVDPFVKRTAAATTAVKPEHREPPAEAETPASVPAAGPEPASPPKAEAIRHALIQTAGGLGFSYRVEQPVLDGTGRVDLVLTRGPLTVAVEISATTPAEHEVGNLLKCLRAGFSHILHVCDATTRRRRLEELLTAQTTPEERGRVRCLTLRQALEHLRELAEAERAANAPAGPPEKSVAAPPLTFAEQESLAARMLARIAERQRRARRDRG